VELEDRDGRFTFSPVSASALWSAYQFLRPGNQVRGLGAQRGDLGLVGIAKNNMRVDGSWDFGVHPAIANTALALDAMRLDLVLTVDDPRLPAVARGWATYRW